MAGSCGGSCGGRRSRRSRPSRSRRSAVARRASGDRTPPAGARPDRLEAFTDERAGRDVTLFITPVEGVPTCRVIDGAERRAELRDAGTQPSHRPPCCTRRWHAHDVPVVGGDTTWADQYLADESLPESVKNRSPTRERRTRRGWPTAPVATSKRSPARSSMTVASCHPTRTPWRHEPLGDPRPWTGRAALYAKPGVHDRDRGDGPRPGEALLAGRPVTRRHRASRAGRHWEPQTLAIWNNNATNTSRSTTTTVSLPRDVRHERLVGTERQPPARALSRSAPPSANRDEAGRSCRGSSRRRPVTARAARERSRVRSGADRCRWSQPVGDDDAFDHVGDDRAAGRYSRRIEHHAPSARRRTTDRHRRAAAGTGNLGPTSPWRRARARAWAARRTRRWWRDSIRQL